MSYFPTMGDIPSSDFNSTKYPGVCKPSTVSALGTFKALQQQLNRIASVKGAGTIAVDGDIGPGTVGLVSRFAADISSFAASIQDIGESAKIAALAGTSSAVAVASIADVIESEAEQYADSLNAPSSPPAPKPAKASTLVLANGQEVAPPAGADLLMAWNQASTPVKIGLIGALGAVGFMMFMPRKGERSK